METEIQQGELATEDTPPPPSYADETKCTDAHKNRLRKFVDSGIAYLHPYNMRRFSMDRKADEFFAINQWLEPSYSNLGTRYTANWSRIQFDKDDPDYIPTPVFDEYSTPVLNESARLGKPDYEPYVRAEGEDPDLRMKQGAHIAEVALAQSLVDMNWEDEQERGLHHMPQYGQWYTLSYWDASWEETVRIPVENSVQCSTPGCDFKLASPDLPPLFAQQFLAGNPDKADRIAQIPQPPNIRRPDIKMVKYQATACLQCDNGEEQQSFGADPLPEPEALGTGSGAVDDFQQPGTATDEGVGNGGLPDPGDSGDDVAPPQAIDGDQPQPMEPRGQLKPFTAVGDELDDTDQFGRLMGEEVPLGKWRLDTLTPDEVFISNFGINVRPGHIEEFWLCRVRPLSWIRNRFVNGGMVKPEATRPLLEFHPIFGERELFQATAPKAFKQHARVKEYHRKPAKQLVLEPNTQQPEKGDDGKLTGRTYRDKGRSIIMANDVVLFDGDFMIESQTNPGELIERCNLDVAQFDFRSGGREIEGVSLGERLFSQCEAANESMSMIQDTQEMQGTPKWIATGGMELDFDNSGGAGGVYYYRPDPLAPNAKPEQVDNKLDNIGVILNVLNYTKDNIARVAHMNDVEEGNVPQGVTAALALQILAEQSNEKRKPRIRRIKEMLERQFSHGLKLMHELVREPRLAWIENEDGTESQQAWQGLDIMGQTSVRIEAEPDHSSSLVKQQTIRDMLGFPQIAEQLLTDPRTRRYIAEELGAPKELFQRYDAQDNAARKEFTAFMEQGNAPIVDNDLDDNESHADRHGLDCLTDKWKAVEADADWNTAWTYLADWEKAYFKGDIKWIPGVMPGMPPAPQMINPIMMDLDQQNVVPSLDVRIKKAWLILLQRRGYPGMQQAAAPPVLGQPPMEPQVSPALDKALTFRAHLAAHVQYAKAEAQAKMMQQPVQAAPGEQPQNSAPGATTQAAA